MVLRVWSSWLKLKDFLVLLLLTAGGLLVHGYHPWAEDAEIYLPGVEKILHPELFPFNAQFFAAHAHLTLFPNLIAASVRITHLPLAWALFFWQVFAIFMLLYSCWELSGLLFSNRTARWAGVALVAALLTLPVAGTALYILDQYTNPRNLTAFVGVLAIVKFLDEKYVTAAVLLIFGAAIHPLMSAFAICFCALLFCMGKFDPRWATAACVVPFLDPPSKAYHEVALAHGFHYPMRWQWYEWLGVIGPIVILWWFSRIARARHMRNLELVSRALVVYQTIFTAAALAVSVPASFETLARLQPMRSLFLLYILFVLISGALLGEYLLKDQWWRWAALFVPLCGGMFYAQRTLFPASAHIEWPWSRPRNPWVQAFDWVRENTPPNAIFALNPYHMQLAGEDEDGFRAIAERSMLADGVKDSGAVSMFPPMANEWFTQMQAQSGWQNFEAGDFRRLRGEYGVDWVVLQQPGVAELSCPYENQAVKVCRVD